MDRWIGGVFTNLSLLGFTFTKVDGQGRNSVFVCKTQRFCRDEVTVFVRSSMGGLWSLFSSLLCLDKRVNSNFEFEIKKADQRMTSPK